MVRRETAGDTGGAAVLERGRAAYAHGRWADAFEDLAEADEQSRLVAEDLCALATVAFLVGHDTVALDAFQRAHHAFQEDGDVGHSVRCAYWLGYVLMLSGRMAEAMGWWMRGQRLLEEDGVQRVEHGYLLIPASLRKVNDGEPRAAYDGFREALAIAERFGDPDLAAWSRLGCGRALIEMSQADRGMAMLDEAMVAVTAGEVSPMLTGRIYCAVIMACRMTFDLRRAQEWTAAFSRWCATQQGLKPYRGQCLIHRSEIMQLHGEWSEAIDEVGQACAHLSDPPGDPVLGMAQYQMGELLRLRGEFAAAEDAYRRAGECGHHVHPGLAMLRLAQGRLDDAVAAIRRVAAESEADRTERARILGAFITIMLAADDVDGARTATEELEQLAADFDAVYLHAVAASARGAVALADGDAHRACASFRRAWQAWQELAAPYEAAEVRLSMAKACRELRDHDTAELELNAARRTFEKLAAAPALEAAMGLSRTTAATDPTLTRRELDVVRLVASGATNRDIARALSISEKTVARHLSNMFGKLGVTSRSGVTAYAYEHDLVPDR
ncbi:helix-turn-helix transcriptional regulator [Haloechinothrix salitolerans]|uniref:LuxR C-terminal-related transcriptional regulator n=1 Tax=Haloechinothrix salitolerans TaxID=926830 RepID=A0ABW2C4L1_9PSEU